jgi:hypothetical protein
LSKQSSLLVSGSPNQGSRFFLISGALAQLVERLHGMQEVSGSNPLCSTKSRAVELLVTNLTEVSRFQSLKPEGSGMQTED